MAVILDAFLPPVQPGKTMQQPPPIAETGSAAVPRRQLTLFDSTSIIVGIIIAAGIYRSSPTVAALAPNVSSLLGVWLLGGFLSLVGALCYAELATAYPYEGGDYVYLTKAFGRPAGFLFGWSQLWIVRPGSIGAMAFAFADYANQIWPRAQGAQITPVLIAYAAGAVVVLSAVNYLGIREGKWTQNGLTTAKVIGLLAVVLVGMSYAAPAVPATDIVQPLAPTSRLSDFGIAMILVLFAYGGWNEMAFVAAEVRYPRPNILRALLLGTLAVTVIYLLVNVAFLHALGLAGARHATAATDVLELAMGPWAGRAISILICISALGAINGQIFTGARIYYAMGSDHRLYSWLGHWDAQRGQPVRSLLLQGVVTVALIIALGSTHAGFESMVIFTTPAFWIFLMLVAVALVMLRWRDPQASRPYRVPAYPWTPLVFCLSCLFMVYASLDWAVRHSSWEATWSIAILLIGVVLSFARSDARPASNGESTTGPEQS
jgi:basic amino acid/polyamine antiporter, APA family